MSALHTISGNIENTHDTVKVNYVQEKQYTTFLGGKTNIHNVLWITEFRMRSDFMFVLQKEEGRKEFLWGFSEIILKTIFGRNVILQNSSKEVHARNIR